jgi:RNA polymerase sigma factor (sigma-70 family)
MIGNPTSSIGESASSTVDLDAQASRAADGELSARFQSDVIPLLEPLYQRAMRMTRNQADAEDLLQETMVKANADFRTLQPGGNFAAWLQRILMNTYISGYCKQQCRPAQYPIDDIAGAQLANTPHRAPGLHSVEEQALKRLGDNQIRAAMQALPEQFPTRGLLRRRGRPPFQGDRRSHAHPGWHRDVAAAPRTAPPAVPAGRRRPTTRIHRGYLTGVTPPTPAPSQNLWR